MKRAILSTCPDARQSSILNVVYPSWEKFAARNDLDIIVIRRPILLDHAYWDRWLCFEQPELDGYDEILWLDNDVWISEGARNPFLTWSGIKVSGVREEKQLGWSRDEIIKYYPTFMIELAEEEHDFAIYNTGVALFSRKHGPLFRQIYDLWRSQWFPKLSSSSDPKFNNKFVREADGPFISWQLQKADSIEELPPQFNYIFWLWYQRTYRLPMKWFIFEARAAKECRKFLPRWLWKILFSHARGVVKSGENSCDFLHLAASKSPLWLLDGGGE